MIQLIPVRGLPEIRPGDDLGALIHDQAELRDGDIVVVAQKAVSKAEGRLVSLTDLEPSEKARELAGDERDPREVEAILREAKEIVRERGPLVIAQTRHGFICASAGVDHSNAPEPGVLVLLPLDPDASAEGLRERLRELSGAVVGVIVTDSFGRPFRQGTTDVAIGVAGVPAIIDLRGTRDRIGYELRGSRTAVADEIAGAADLARGKAEGIPVVIVRGLRLEGAAGTGQELVIEPELDLFR
jgi:coenzyme F420-0:L-glutamate ligase / coenzyme F420-1:gamma-L-glutamate ligase